MFGLRKKRQPSTQPLDIRHGSPAPENRDGYQSNLDLPAAVIPDGPQAGQYGVALHGVIFHGEDNDLLLQLTQQHNVTVTSLRLQLEDGYTKHTSYYAHGENQSEVEAFRMKTSALSCHRTEQYARQQQDKFLFELVTK